MAVERALISVFDKTGVLEFAKRLAALKIEILSTGGTSKLLRESGVAVKDVSEFTGWPEMLGGRVKTLHPKVHGGLLFRRNHAEDQKQAAEHGIAPIDLVVVNLYPFEATAAKSGLTAEELIENIDIGGPTMLRSAAKNLESVTVVCDPADYDRVASELEANKETSLATRLELARKVFATTSRYDGMITTELERLVASGNQVELAAKPVLPERVHIALRRQQELRYGENPHQAAALYVPAGKIPEGLAAAKQLQGKELSYNNLVDLEAARSLAAEFAKSPPAARPGNGAVIASIHPERPLDGLAAEIKQIADQGKLPVVVQYSAPIPRAGSVKPPEFPVRFAHLGVPIAWPVTPSELLDGSDVEHLISLLEMYVRGPFTPGGRVAGYAARGSAGLGRPQQAPPVTELIGQLITTYGASGHEDAVREKVK